MTTPTHGPASSPKAQATLRNREKKRNAMIDLGVKEWMDGAGGRMLLFWLLDDVCDVDGSSFVDDPYHTAFNEGVRAVGIKIRGRVKNTAPDMYVRAMAEEIQRRKIEDDLRETTDLGDEDE